MKVKTSTALIPKKGMTDSQLVKKYDKSDKQYSTSNIGFNESLKKMKVSYEKGKLK